MQVRILESMQQTIERSAESEEYRDLLRLFLSSKDWHHSKWSECVIETYRLFGGADDMIIDAAAALELLMLAQDILDDLQDEDHEEAPWMTCPKGLALNAMMSLVFGAMNEIGRLDREHGKNGAVIRKLNKYVLQALDGQFRDLQGDIQTEQQYVEIAYSKSAVLLRLACYMGYVWTQVSEKQMKMMDELAENLGMTAQIYNDLNDLQRWEEKSDMRMKKKTLPILMMLSDEENRLTRSYFDGTLSWDELAASKARWDDEKEASGAVEACQVIVRMYRNRARRLLDELDVDAERKQRFWERIVKP
ncbi:polyprenyl synthetase family protein [Marinicrinis lubricantis]|uniref:Polyprenyl synthetase family protein n=1 Tax=Marinicrinis lubricantis TaxID=2086470 RepID=A0ABW1IJ72_9BACL